MVSRNLLLAVTVAVLVGGAMAATGAPIGTATAQQNETVIHEHPDTVSDNADLEAIATWLENRMVQIHVDCSDSLVADATGGCDSLDDEYTQALSRYTEVSGATGDESTSETFNETRTDQQKLATLTEEFWEEYDEYREARQTGDAATARQHARRLESLHREIEELGGELDVEFATLETNTSANFTAARSATTETTETVTIVTEEAERESFTPSTLAATPNRSRVAFTDPVSIRGRVVDQNGSAIPDGRIVVVVDGVDVNDARTNETGHYTVAYRPVTTAAGPTNVTLEYRPADSSPYLGAEDTLDLTVTAVDPEVTITQSPSVTQFGDPVPIEGHVTVAGNPVENTSVHATLGGQLLDRTRTDATGTYTLNTTLPATVAPGSQSLTVQASRSNLAISPKTTTRSVDVHSTPTSLSIETTDQGDDLRLDGRFLTDDDTPIENRQLSVSVNGAHVGQIRTADDGTYRTVIALDEATANTAGPRQTLTIEYADPSTNLEPARAETEYMTGSTWAPYLMLLKAILSYRSVQSLLIAVILGVALGIGSRLQTRHLPASQLPGTNVSAPTATDDDAFEVDPTDVDPAVRAAAASLEDAPPTQRTRLAYRVVRAALDDGSSRTRTHREFLDARRPELSDDQVASLETLTAAYERAIYSPTAMDDATATDATKAAAQLLPGMFQHDAAQ